MKKNLFVLGIGALVIIISLVVAVITCYDKNKKYESDIEDLKIKKSKLEDTIKEYEDSQLFPYRNKVCTYIETYEFVDYYDSKERFLIIVDKELTKDAPKLLMLDPTKFERSFVKNQSYEFTFQKEITYRKDNNQFEEKINVIKIEPTDKRGMDQVDEFCILK